MKKVIFYKSKSGKNPINDFFDSLSFKETEKVLWVLKLVRESEFLSTKYYKKLVNSDDIIEIRTQLGSNSFRLLGFEHNGNIVVLTNGFRKKDQKIPKKEIELAKRRKKEYLNG